jgi:hypothetical protein
MSDPKRPLHIVELIGVILVLSAFPIALAGIVLPTNEHSWMAAAGHVAPDCDIITGALLFPTAPIFVGGLVGFAIAARRRRSIPRLAAAAISAIMLVGIALKLPTYWSESAKAAELCSR